MNNGWAVAMTLLGYERGEAAATMPMRFQGELDRLMALARERGLTAIRSSVSGWRSATRRSQIMRFNGMRVLTRFLAGQHPGPGGSDLKVYWSEYHKLITELGMDILGADALVPTGRCRRGRSRPTIAGAPNSSARGPRPSSPPGPGRSTRARARCSATSSARWCSGCRRNLRADTGTWAELQAHRCVAAVVRRPRPLVRPRLRQWVRLTPRGRWHRSALPARSRPALARLPHADAVRRPPSQTRDDGRDLVSHVVSRVAAMSPR